MRLISVVAILLTSCINATEAEQAARNWASSMKYEVVGLNCSRPYMTRCYCDLHVKDVIKPVTLVCVTNDFGAQCRVIP